MTDNTAVSVLIVDDHERMRESLKMFLDTCDGIEVAGQAGDRETALDFLKGQSVDVILIDVRLGESDGVTLAKELREMGVESKMIGLSFHTDEEIRDRMIKAGVDDYVDKSADPSQLVEVIMTLTRGK